MWLGPEELPELEQPTHSAVAWLTTGARPTARVTCPACGVERLEVAKQVRYRIRAGKFTGICKACVGPTRSQGAPRPEHPAVDWTTLSAWNGGWRVQVTCPVCRLARMVEAKTVRKQLKSASFTGLCHPDRFAAQDPARLPTARGLDWGDYEMVREPGTQRRRKFIRVYCPVCGQVRLSHGSHLKASVSAGTFRPECLIHRRPAPELIEMLLKVVRAHDWSRARGPAVKARILSALGEQDLQQVPAG